jgi:hypothetical protein
MDKAKLDEVRQDNNKVRLLEKTAAIASYANEKASSQQLSTETLKNDRLPYLKQKRFYGEGEIRIGNRLTLGDDIYCAGFIAYLSDEIIK